MFKTPHPPFHFQQDKIYFDDIVTQLLSPRLDKKGDLFNLSIRTESKNLKANV